MWTDVTGMNSVKNLFTQSNTPPLLGSKFLDETISSFFPCLLMLLRAPGAVRLIILQISIAPGKHFMLILQRTTQASGDYLSSELIF